jgi:hypothetical protein
MPRSIPLDQFTDVRIASPCSVPWESMRGDDKTRHCALCNLNVHNFGAMTSEEIDAILRAAGGGSVCARIYRRADGTVLTADCPVGLAAVRARIRRTAARVVAALGLVCSAGLLLAQGQKRPWDRARLARLEPFATIYEKISPTPVQVGPALAGRIVSPSYNINLPPSNPPPPFAGEQP